MFNHLEDGYDIHSLARVCKGMQEVAKDSVRQHAAFVNTHGAAVLRNHESMSDFLELVQRSPRIAAAVVRLTVQCEARWSAEFGTPTKLANILQVLPNLRSFSLHIMSEDSATSSRFCDALLSESVQLPHLRAFSTTMRYTPDILRFIHRHPTIRELSITGAQDLALGANANANGRDEPASVLPALRTLACGLPILLRLGRCSTLTHLHVLLHGPQTLETVASLLGAQLVSLRLGVLERLRDLYSPRVVWSTQDILARFPRLTYIQVHMFEVRPVSDRFSLSPSSHSR